MNDAAGALYLVLVFVMAIFGVLALVLGLYHEVAHWQDWDCGCTR